MARWHVSLFLVLLSLSSCNGWDDDSEYEILSRAAYFVCETDVSNHLTVHQLVDTTFIWSWNNQVGVPDEDFSDLKFEEGYLWLSSGNQRKLLQIQPKDNSIENQWTNLSIRPHHFAIGEKYILIGDTLEEQLAFIKRRNGKVYQTGLGGPPGHILYNHGRFFLEQGYSSYVVYDELALAQRSTFTFNHPILESQFDRYKNLHITTADSSDYYYGALSGVNDVFREDALVNFGRTRYSNYYDDKFGSEFLLDLRQYGPELRAGSVVYADSVEDFEVDFFASQLYYTWEGEMFRKDLKTDRVLTLGVFPERIVRSVYWVGVQ